MRYASAEALLLDVRELGERDRVVTFLTADRGKLAGVARGARHKYSRFSGQLQPLAKVNVGWFEKEGRDLVRIARVELLRPAGAVQADLEGILLGSYLADHLLTFAQEEEREGRYYRLLDSTLEALAGGVDRRLAARYFETWVLRLAGIFPPPRECPLCERPFAAGDEARLGAGGEALLCTRCGGPAELRVSPAALELLRRIGREALPRLAEQPPRPAVLAEVQRLAARVRRPFLGRELRSYDVIRRTLAGQPGFLG